MLTSVTPAHFAKSVLAVPPLALTADLSINGPENAAQIAHLESGGISTLLYGGNANVYSWQVSKFAGWMDALEGMVAEDTWLIPSVGPDWGKLLDQAAILKHRSYPVAMVLPMVSPKTNAGVVRGIEAFVERSGKPVLVYIKTDNYIAAEALGRLVEQGAVFGVKYAVPRVDPRQDAYLDAIILAIGRERVISGFGEIQALSHLLDFGIAGFTAGCVCIAPRLSMLYLEALLRRDRSGAETLMEHFKPLESIRERLHPIRVLHSAVSLSGIAQMGPMLPLLNEADLADHGVIGEAARTLLSGEMRARKTVELASGTKRS
jgi:dihydrodipicolinate synthase/N-acetylneuraminate lyase